jgi:hypothetical protein
LTARLVVLPYQILGWFTFGPIAAETGRRYEPR